MGATRDRQNFKALPLDFQSHVVSKLNMIERRQELKWANGCFAYWASKWKFLKWKASIAPVPVSTSAGLFVTLERLDSQHHHGVLPVLIALRAAHIDLDRVDL